MFLQCGKKFEKYFSLDVKGFPVPFSINSKHVSKFSTWTVTYDVEISRTVFTHDNYKKKHVEDIQILKNGWKTLNNKYPEPMAVNGRI